MTPGRRDAVGLRSGVNRAARHTCRVPSTFGLCDACVHQRVVGNTRGSRFSLCGRAKADERFPRYPRMPVGDCSGFVRRGPDPGGPAGS